MLRRACEELAADARANKPEGMAESGDEFVELDKIKNRVEALNHGHAVEEKELLDICETEGNDVNGGGGFDVRDDHQGSKSIRFVPGDGWPIPRTMQKAVGQIWPATPLDLKTFKLPPGKSR